MVYWSLGASFSLRQILHLRKNKFSNKLQKAYEISNAGDSLAVADPTASPAILGWPLAERMESTRLGSYTIRRSRRDPFMTLPGDYFYQYNAALRACP